MARFERATVVGLLGVALTATHAAGSITSSFGNFVDRSLSSVVSGVRYPNVTGEFLQRVALGSIQLPVPANSVSLTYTYNPSIGAFERSSGSLGPVFVDRGETIGKGRFDLVFSYQFANLTDLDGENFGEQLEFGFQAQTAEGAQVAGAFVGQDFSLKENVFSFNLTYGISDRWDVNLLVPLVYTTLNVDGLAAGSVDGVSSPVSSQSFQDAAFGIGDILLRTKYRFYDNPDVALLAGALTLRMPSGSAGNFHGLGDFTITPTFIASRPFGRHDIHMNLGMEFNTADSERTRARYAIGATLQPFEKLAFLLDFLGSSGLDDDHFTIPISGGNVVPGCGVVNCVNYAVNAAGTTIDGVVPRTNIADLSMGIKFNPFENANIFLLAIVPLNQQGLRAAVVPAGGFEWTF